MVSIIIGGSGSGKSEYAEDLIVQYSKESTSSLIYIATMQAFDDETIKRIEKHQKMRQNKNFTTMEFPIGLDQVKLPKNSSVLLECLSNLVANEMFAEDGAKENTLEAVLRGIDNLIQQGKHVVVVTNNVFEDGAKYDSTMIEYLRILGEMNRRISIQAHQVIEVVHGIPVLIR